MNVNRNYLDSTSGGPGINPTSKRTAQTESVFDVVKQELGAIAAVMGDNPEGLEIKESSWDHGIKSSRPVKNYLNTLPDRIRSGHADPHAALEAIDRAIKVIAEKAAANTYFIKRYGEVKSVVRRLQCAAFLIAEGPGFHPTSKGLASRFDGLASRDLKKYGQYLLERCASDAAVYALLDKGVDPNRQYEKTFPRQRDRYGAHLEFYPSARKETVLLGELRKNMRHEKIQALISHPKTNINHVNYWVRFGIDSDKETKAGDLSILHYMGARSAQIDLFLPLLLQKVPTNEKAPFMGMRILQSLQRDTLEAVAGVVAKLDKEMLSKIDDNARAYLNEQFPRTGKRVS